MKPVAFPQKIPLWVPERAGNRLKANSTPKLRKGQHFPPLRLTRTKVSVAAGRT